MQAMINKLIDVAARRYARRVWWCDEEELRQVGFLAACLAKRTYSPDMEPEPYFWKAIIVSMSRYLWKESAPVSGGGHKPRELRAGLRRASLFKQHEDGTEEEYLEDARELVDSVVDSETWRRRVRARLRQLAKRDRYLVAIVLEESTPSEVAESRGEPVSKTYAKRGRLMERAMQDPELYSLMEMRKDC